jgi:hypothetical protein
MLASLEGVNSISCAVRQEIRMFGQEYRTFGTYNELKPADEFLGLGVVRFRLDLTVQPPADATETDSKNSLTIVGDNEYNYLYRNSSLEGENRFERIEIKRVVEAIEKQGRNDIPTGVGSMLGLGGLTGMLREMRNRYDFSTEPAKTQINEKTKAITVWKIHGRLKPEIVAKLTEEVAGKKQMVPTHTPTAVDIYFGMNDGFPYRFDYFRTADGTDSKTDPFASLLFYNIVLHDRKIPEAIFDYRPPDNMTPIDITDQIVNQLLR